MTTITLPPDVEGPLLEQARRYGTTPESLAVASLRRLFVPQSVGGEPSPGETMFDFLSGYVGTVDGTSEALSENCGERFVQGLLDKP